MTPFIIPQVFLIKSLIREIYSRGTAGSGFLIIVDEISEFFVRDKGSENSVELLYFYFLILYLNRWSR